MAKGKKTVIAYDEDGKPINKERFRNFHVLLYPDNESHMKALELIKLSYRFILILHDKDVKEDGSGELKKAHYHVLLKFPQARWNTALAEELGIELRFIMPSKDFTHDLRYLVHADNVDKFQYDMNCVEGNLIPLFNKAMNDNIEDENMLELMCLLDSFPCVVTYRQFVTVVCEKGLYSDFRRSSYVMGQLINEHNYEVRQYERN